MSFKILVIASLTTSNGVAVTSKEISFDAFQEAETALKQLKGRTLSTAYHSIEVIRLYAY